MSALATVLSLEDCLDALIDYRGKTPVKTDSGIPLITAKIIKGGRIETPTEFIAKDDYVALDAPRDSPRGRRCIDS